MGTLVELWMRSFKMPSIQAVAVVSSMEGGVRGGTAGAGRNAAEARVPLVFLFLSGGNKGRPEKPHTAGG